MSNLKARLMKPTGLEYHDLAFEIDREIWNFIRHEYKNKSRGNGEGALPVRYWQTHALPLHQECWRMITKITYANSIYPTTQEELDTRRRYQQEAIGHNESLLQLMRLTLNEIPSIDANKLNRAVERLLEDCRALWTALGIRLNPRKVQIIPLRRFSFMKVRFLLTDTGRVIMKPCRKSFARMRRKLRAFRDLMTGADMTPEQVNTSYQSWYGYQDHLNAHRALRRMDRYYHALFGQWPRHGKGGKNHDLQLLCG